MLNAFLFLFFFMEQMWRNTLRVFQGFKVTEYHLPVILVPPIKIQNGHINVKSKKKTIFTTGNIFLKANNALWRF